MSIQLLGDIELPIRRCMITTREVSPQDMPNVMSDVLKKLVLAADLVIEGHPFTVYRLCNGRAFLEAMMGEEGEKSETDGDVIFTIDLAAPVSDKAIADKFEVREIRGGTYFHARAIGPYLELHNAWRKSFNEIEKEKLEIALDRPPLEVYENSPMDTPSEELATSVYIPIVSSVSADFLSHPGDEAPEADSGQS